MRKYFVLSVFYLFAFISMSYSQETKKVYNTIVFEKNMPHSVLNSNSPQKDLKIEIFGDKNFKENFSSTISKNSLVISCIPDQKNLQTLNLSLSPETNFDNLKLLLIECGTEYVSIEDTIIPIKNWYEFNNDQIRKLWELNFTITNIEAKRKWVMQNPAQFEKAKQNGWWDDNTKLLNEAINNKKVYLRQILK